MKLEENDKFLDYQDIESQLFQKGNYGHTGGLRSRSSIILSQEPSRSIFHSRLTPKAEEAEVRFHVGDHEDQDEDRSVLFTQLNELVPVNDGVLWKESARWVRFEEKTEDGGERWSKPHVTTLSLHSLFELRTCFERGIISLDVENNTFKEIVEHILKQKICTDRTTEEENENILYTLLQGHVHHIKKSYRNRIKDAIKLNKGKKTSPKNTLLELPEKPSSEQLKNKFRKKIPVGTEVANILVGEVDYLNQPFAAFIRLKDADVLGTLTEVALPTRFIFILLGPSGNAKACHEIGRAIATLLTDELFRKISYKAMNRDELISGIDDFLDEVAVLPPGRWDPTVRIQPPKFLPSVHRRQAILQRESKNHCNGKLNETEKLAHGHPHVSEELLKTTKFFGGLIKDIRRKAPWYWSDFYDALNLQCLSAILFIYLATVTNSITFGGMLGDATDNMQGVLENFIGTAICGGFFCIFSGQPLTILSSTGPVLVFERLLYSFSKDYNFEYLEFRLWIGLWVAFYCLILVATNAAYLVQYFTRFTEESFCALISCIFIYDAMKKMLNLADHFPVNWKYNIDNMTQYSCKCNLLEMGNESSSNFTLYDPFYYVNMQDPINLTRGQCIEFGGHLEGISCNYVPDVFLMSVILFLGTFLCTASLKSFQTSRYLSTSIRKLTGDFSVILTIAIFCTVDVMCGLETPKLVVPNEFKPTNPNRSWFVYPFGGNPWWVCLLSGIPAILITILLFMDQQITAVILNRKEYKLKKGAGLHLDFFCISLLIILTSFMGLPWYVSATVISLAHMNSLKMETTVSAPGEQPKFLGIREQRVTGLAVFILTGISVFLSPVLKYIPMPVLYGIFLQMGVTALRSIQFTERLKLLFIPPKHQPDVIYLRHVPLRKVHFFTLVQLSCLIILWILKSTVAAIIFPLMLLALAGIRKAMECIFSLHDLSWLDDILPEKIVTDEEPKTEDSDSTDSEDTELKYQEKAPEINISVN